MLFYACLIFRLGIGLLGSPELRLAIRRCLDLFSHILWVVKFLFFFSRNKKAGASQCAVKQIAEKEFATLRQQRNTGASLVPTDKESDMNGSRVSNGHPTVNAGQANDHLAGDANDHFATDANGHALGRNYSSVTDSEYPIFSKTASGLTEPTTNSAPHERRQNAEVCT